VKPVRFHPDAEAEMIAAVAYYESQQQGLGRRFLASVQDTIDRIQANPLSYHLIDVDVRRCLTRTFPYGVLFRVRPEDLVVIAVMHLHRHPDYWKGRIRTT
jgi:toxin ParE1/3/4